MRYFEQQRIDWIYKRRAPLNRKHLMDKFGISAPQATNDIRKFIKLYPGVWEYNVQKKRYERVDG